MKIWKLFLLLAAVTHNFGCTSDEHLEEPLSPSGPETAYQRHALSERDMADEEGAVDVAMEPPAMSEPQPLTAPPSQLHTERYAHIEENSFKNVRATPLSTFSIDVDTAGYSIVRRHLNDGVMPPSSAVRIEEMLNYFDYKYESPKGEHPFAVHTVVSNAPWSRENQIVRVAIKGRDIAPEKRPDANLIFLIDVSGSMEDANKLPLLKESMKMLVKRLGNDDRVGIVVYAGASGVVLEPTSDREEIFAALDRLQAGGSTNGGAGINLAYKLAKKNFRQEGINRVILATDGDFNVGLTSEASLVELIEEKAKSGIFLSVLGFGSGNYNDAAMEKLADKGNGNYAYLDTIDEANKVLVKNLSGTLVTIAKDVKIQVEFNPALVKTYRLIGYENRALAAEDFNDDKKDAGEIGAGHMVTALYEIVPVGSTVAEPSVDALRYQSKKKFAKKSVSEELLTVKVRYKKPDGGDSILLTKIVSKVVTPIEKADSDFRFATAVAGFGMKLRKSKFSGDFHYADILSLAKSGMGSDDDGYRTEFLQLIRKAERLDAH